MKKPDHVTITTFWLDWVLLPVTFVVGVVTMRWAFRDYNVAKKLLSKEKSIPPFLYSLPLIITSLAWFIVGPASLIKDEYYEHRIWCGVLALWACACLIGAIVATVNMLMFPKKHVFSAATHTVGLLLVGFSLMFPALIDVPLGHDAVIFSVVWNIIMITCGICFVVGEFKGYPYLFPRIGLAIVLLFFFSAAALEIPISQPVAPWFARLWDFQMSQGTFESGLPTSIWWRIDGLINLVIGSGIVFWLVARRRKIKKKLL